jgi:hypothetical protein
MDARRAFASICLAIGVGLPGLDPATGSETTDAPEVTPIIVWADGRWNYVSMIEDRNGTIIYQKPGKSVVAAKQDTVDKKITFEVNDALSEFAAACGGEQVDLSRMFELDGRSGKLFHPLAARMSRECYQRLGSEYQQRSKTRQATGGEDRLAAIAGDIELHKGKEETATITDQTLERSDDYEAGIDWGGSAYGRCMASRHPRVIQAFNSITKPEDSDLQGGEWRAGTISSCRDLQSSATAVKACVPDSAHEDAHAKFVAAMNVFVTAAEHMEGCLENGDMTGFERGYRAMLDGLTPLARALGAMRELSPSPRPRHTTRNPLEEFFTADVESTVTAHCLEEWPDDREMRDYCERKQLEAVEKLKAANPYMLGLDPTTFEGIRNRCRSEWRDDYEMREYCERKQIEAQ